jgi:hypothetical protein
LRSAEAALVSNAIAPFNQLDLLHVAGLRGEVPSRFITPVQHERIGKAPSPPILS